MLMRENIAKELIKNKSVLDLGSSWGDFSEFIKSNSKEYYDFDIEPGAYYQGDLNQPQTFDKKFDVVVAGELIEHLSQTDTFLNNCKNGLKDDGTLFLTTPNPTSFKFFFYALLGKEPRYTGHIKYFTKDALELLLKKHFEIIDIGYCFHTTNMPKKTLFFKIKFKIECLIGDVVPRLSPHIYAIAKKMKK